MKTVLKLRLLGGFDINVSGRETPVFRTRTGQWLLALLALRFERTYERDTLASLLWPDAPTETALANLRRTLTDVKRELGAAATFITAPTPRTLRLVETLPGENGACWIDVAEFDTRTRAISTASEALLEQAVALYTGPLLLGCGTEWVTAERGRREEQFLQACETLAERACERGDMERAESFLRRALAAQPQRETVLRSLLCALARQGNYAAAQIAFREFRALLRKSGLAPDKSTITLMESLQRPEPAAVRPAERIPCINTVPLPLNTLIGREKDTQALVALLTTSSDTPRLVTVTGPGGIGKTRLALALAHECAANIPNTVFVNLAPVRPEENVADVVARALQLDAGSDGIIAALQRFFQNRVFLLVLDNCEQISSDCARFAVALLTQCPKLRLLATSRQPLGVPGERLWRLEPLQVPAPAADPLAVLSLDALRTFSAVRLFVERATQFAQEFSLCEHNAPAVIEICRHTDGVPLALELAAAWIPALSPPEIAKRLRDHACLLDGRDTSPTDSAKPRARQETLRATLTWSYDLLTVPEQRLFARLAVFADGFERTAAETVCSHHGIARRDVAPLLASLVDKSLVTIIGRQAANANDEPSPTRYRLLETIRAFAIQQQAANPTEAQQTQERLRRYFVVALKRRLSHWHADDATRRGLYRWVEQEANNLKGSIGLDPSPKTAALIHALATLRFEHGNFAEAAHLLQPYLCRYARTPFDQTRFESRLNSSQARTGARLLTTAGDTALMQGEVTTAGHYACEARRLLENLLESAPRRASTVWTSYAWCLRLCGAVKRQQQDFQAVFALGEQARAIYVRCNDDRMNRWMLGALAQAAQETQDWERAEAYYNEHLRLSDRDNNRREVAFVKRRLAHLALVQENFAKARDYTLECFADAQACENWWEMALAQSYLAQFAWGQESDGLQARYLAHNAVELARRINLRNGMVFTILSEAAATLAAAGSVNEAKVYLAEAIRSAKAVGCQESPEVLGSLLTAGGIVALVFGDEERAALLRGAESALLKKVPIASATRKDAGDPTRALLALGPRFADAQKRLGTQAWNAQVKRATALPVQTLLQLLEATAGTAALSQATNGVE